MSKTYSNGEALSLLGSIVLLNEKLDDFVNNCAVDDLYCYLPCVEDIAFRMRKEPILYPKINISLDHREAYHILMDVKQKASEVRDLSTCQEIADLLGSLNILSTAIEDKNKN